LGSKLRKRLELQRRKKRRGVNCCLKARIAEEKRKEEERIAIKVAKTTRIAEEGGGCDDIVHLFILSACSMLIG